ncbi:MAG: beta-galactosidase [Dorea sp.]|nr:beta-galactosidase [Dorea sp.]
MGYGKHVKKILYGGDYNPEQWPEEVWQEDMRMMKKAHINMVTLNVFSWAALQPDEDTYDFAKLDKIMELVRENGLQACMATSTGAHPAWMAKRHPDILRTENNGMKRKFGGRHNSCPNSPSYRKYAPRLAKELVRRYKDYDNIAAWHVSNEFGGECYCENCGKAFREWLKEKYGTIEEVNRCYNTSFWSHTFYDWDEIVLPNFLSEHFDYDGRNVTMFQGISLDYRRFMSDSILECFRLEYDVLKREMPDTPVTTNLMGFYKELDYQKWGKYMDFVSWDSYPMPDNTPAETALNHDLMRGIGGQDSFVLMEQTPSVTNWHPCCRLKRPGVMRLLSYQAAAHGADAVQFFQIRRTVGACEKFHGAVIDHAGREDTRVFREVTQLGEELERLGDVFLDGRTPAETAVLFDWDNWWAVEYSAGPSVRMKYLDAVSDYYTALYSQNIPVDILCDILHLQGAGCVSTYQKDFYQGTPVITVNTYGKGKAWYVGTRSSRGFYQTFVNDIIREAGIRGVMETPEGVEAAVRETEKGAVLFLLNHNEKEEEVILEKEYRDLLENTACHSQGRMVLPPKGVKLLWTEKQ